MADTRITVNGQSYDSPDAMPPEVRRTYEEAMRSLGPLTDGGSTQVFGRTGEHFGASVVVNKVITVNNRSYRSLDEVPPELRHEVGDALRGAVPDVHPRAQFRVSLNLGSPEARRQDASREPTPLPIEPSSTEATIRAIPLSLAVLIVIALIFWYFLGR